MVALKAYQSRFSSWQMEILFETALPISPQKISEMQTSDHGLVGHEQHKQHEKVKFQLVHSCLHEVSFASTSYLELCRSTNLSPVGCCKWHSSGRSSSSSTTAERDHILCLGAGNNAIIAVVEMGGGKTGRQLRQRRCCNCKVCVFLFFICGCVHRDIDKALHLREMLIGELGVLQGNCMELFLMLVVCMARLRIWTPATWSTLHVFILSHSCRTTLGLWRISWMGLVCPSESCGWTTFCLRFNSLFFWKEVL